MGRKKKRRIVRIKKPQIPQTPADIRLIAHDKGMTTREYVEHLAQLNRDPSLKHNRSATYNMGPEPWLTENGSYDRVEKGIRKPKK